MGLKLFNTLSRSLEEFSPLESAGRRVGMYCCGPTVYDFAHVGNWRTFVLADLVRRTLEFKGFEVTHVMNVTDVDDKIIQRAAASGTPPREFTGRFEQAFFEDLNTLNCLPPHHRPRATEDVPRMIALIEKLIGRGIAYKAADGSVYFSIQKYQAAGGRYGRLVTLNADGMHGEARINSDDYAKDSAADFALWKARSPEDGSVFWPSPFGEGRPGWHIECSAMSMNILGPSFDLHIGGEDLIFPHHEDEIAQSEGATGKPFVKYWLHGAHLLVEGRKMSKSLGNFFTLRDLIGKGFTGREVRRLLLTAHYRETFNFTMDGLHGARAALARIDECLEKLREIAGSAPGGGGENSGGEGGGDMLRQFGGALDDDLNVSAAWASVFEWVADLNRGMTEKAIGSAGAKSALTAWQKMDSVLGVGAPSDAKVPAEIVSLMAARQAARKERNFRQADEIRSELKARGWTVEDTPKGPKAKKI
ncbi:MAG: cysteine--tRNA ligase [Verrucomicrobia bacterium]|nr:cysteine--tRNA ligase [Verrucomicrobiota bacterium]MDE3100019.1 cysteine--tRNA ligase [Verrucomicrobiota bacterium]